jgi:dTDP-4-dehydrorhamnose 3,5-epimerase
MSFVFTPNDKIPDVIIIENKIHLDNRGFFSEIFRADEFKNNGLPEFIQENHSMSYPVCIRGLHYQLNPKPQAKLVSCPSGYIIDIAVDIRKGSPTYGDWVAVDLNQDNGRMLYIPSGFAHGFVAFGALPAHVVYKVSSYYSPKYDRCISWKDPQININWSFPGSKKAIINISDKDNNAPLLKDAENNFVY